MARAQALSLVCTMAAVLGGAAALSLFNLTGPFVLGGRPSGFTLVNLAALYMDHFGVSALLSVTLWFALTAAAREGTRPRSRWATVCLEAMTWLLLISLAVRIMTVVGHGLPWSSPLRSTAAALDLAVASGAALSLGRIVGGSRLLLSPRWSWLLAALVSCWVPMAIGLLEGGAGQYISFWLRIAFYPLCFSSCWAVWEEEQDASPSAAHGVLLGIIIYLPANMFLTYEHFYGDIGLGDIKAAYLLVLLAAGINAGALVVPAALRLWRGEGRRLVLFSMLVGLCLLTSATFPAIVPPWEQETRGLVNRMAISVPQALIGALLIMSTRATLVLRRGDPLGNPQRGTCLVWLLLALGFLVSVLVRDWLWSYEVWVEKEQWDVDVRFRAQVANSWVLMAFVVLMSMVPPVVRVVRSSWPSRRPAGS